MRKSSINIQNLSKESFEHNHRKYTLKNAINDISENEYYQPFLDTFMYKTVETKHGKYEKLDFEKIENVLKENYTKTTKQKPQPKSVYFKEAVINTDKHITIDHFIKLSNVLKKEFNITVLDIAHHKDEGYIDENDEKCINYHAHLIFINADLDTGKTIKFDKQKLRNLQTIVAETLEMPRGESGSKNRRIEHKDYKVLKKQIYDLQNKVKELEKPHIIIKKSSFEPSL